MYQGTAPWATRQHARSLKQKALFASVEGDRAATDALCRLVYGFPYLATLEPIAPSLGVEPGNTGMDAFLHLALQHSHWLAPPEDWQPPPGDSAPAASLATLLRHLLGRYPVAAPLDIAFCMGFDPLGNAGREWFVHMGCGGKQQDLRFPLPMTHRAVHFFLQAPAGFPLAAALRWGQILALNGREALAFALRDTRLQTLQTDEAFWFTVTTFLVNNPLPADQVGPLIDFIHARRFGEGDAPDAGFTMKGRTAASLLRDVSEWHDTLARLSTSTGQWQPSGITPFALATPDPLSGATAHWRIVELNDSLSLADEGREMRHCVRTYGRDCVAGHKSIWSLRLRLSDGGSRRLLTIEVSTARHAIVQVRGKCNQTLPALRANKRVMLARDLLRQWAKEQHLGIACSL